MARIAVNKRKIINDPVYGFISFPYESNFNLIEHPLLQRLRRIKQLGQTNFVYPGANHSRFQHVLGAGYLMTQAIQIIRSKGHIITEEEEEGVINAILLHDIGHGPFSHSLERSIIEGINHESISLFFMQKLNREFGGQLQTAIEIFTNSYPKKFLHQLVAGQLDMDRLDYLKRDSFFTGVTEGVIGSDRIIQMLNVKDDELVVDIKGIYSVEKFLVARRLMFWQVYFHKTVISAENILIRVLKRAKELTLRGENLYASPPLKYFLKFHLNNRHDGLHVNEEMLDIFAGLDDTDIISASKIWAYHDDTILSKLCSALINRKLFRIEMEKKPFPESKIKDLRSKIMKAYNLKANEAEYFVHSGELENNTYDTMDENIKIMKKDGSIMDIAKASDLFNLNVLSNRVKKYYLTYPKEII